LPSGLTPLSFFRERSSRHFALNCSRSVSDGTDPVVKNQKRKVNSMAKGSSGGGGKGQGNGGGWPSTTGSSSGGGRSNAPTGGK